MAACARISHVAFGAARIYPGKLADIAIEADIEFDTLQKLAGTKQNVFLCAMDRIGEEAIEICEKLARSDRNAVLRMRDALTARVLLRYDAVRPYEAGFRELLAAVGQYHFARIQTHYLREQNILKRILDDGVRSGLFRSNVCIETASRAMLVATNSLLPQYLRSREWNDRALVETTAGTIADLLIRGVRVRTMRPKPRTSAPARAVSPSDSTTSPLTNCC